MYIEISISNFGSNVCVGFERKDKLQISNISFYYKRYSGNNKNIEIGRSGIQLLLDGDTWITRYNSTKNDYYSNS